MSDYLKKSLNELLDLEDHIESQDKKNTANQYKVDIETVTINAGGETPVRESLPTTIDNPPSEEEQKFGLVDYVPKDLDVRELSDETDKDDKALARAAIRNVIQVSTGNLEGLLRLAQATEHPRAFEVAATFAKTIVDAAGKLDDLVSGKAGNKKGVSNNDTPSVNYNQQNNIIMTAENAMDMLRQAHLDKKAAQAMIENQSKK